MAGCAPPRAMKQKWLFWKDTESSYGCHIYPHPHLCLQLQGISVAFCSAQSPSWSGRVEVSESREAENLRKVKGMYAEVDAQWIRTQAVQAGRPEFKSVVPP